MKKFINSFKYAFNGIISSFRSERNMKVHIVIKFLVILTGILLNINKVEWLICILCFGLVISSELFNTSIEIIVNMISPNKNDNAKRIKDISAGAVLVNAIVSFVVGVIIFLPKIIIIFK